MQIYVSGSLAFDRIMTFPGKFQDHILPDKLHILNVCFLVDGMDELIGGTAGNIAYTLALLGEKPTILSCAGKDFAPYAEHLAKLGLPMEGIRQLEDEFTAGAYITTDKSDNQITGFNPAAMKEPCGFEIPDVTGNAFGIISPGNIADMLGYPEQYKAKGIPYAFDPGQQVTALSGEQMAKAIDGAAYLMTNDYELQLVVNATGMSEAEILAKLDVGLVTTLGEKGSRITTKDGVIEVGPAKISEAKDPTGAGDAFRAGFIKGLSEGKELKECGQMGAVAAAYCVECHGTQCHAFSEIEYRERYAQNFG